jgi:rSAM/selenodomain-associated transferase 2
MVDGRVATPSANLAPFVTVIIPVLDDTAALSTSLPCLLPDPTIEIVVVDGAPDASDAAMARMRAERPDVVWASGGAGRGRQMNVGARLARGRWLLFLHADTTLGDGWRAALRSIDERAFVGGSFAFRLATPASWGRWIEHAVDWRVRAVDLPYGDQALFVRRDVFKEVGGYHEMPLMEDVDLVRRLRRRGRLSHLDVPALTSARRWERDGWCRRSAENVALIALYFAGVDPARLARWYRRSRT